MPVDGSSSSDAGDPLDATFADRALTGVGEPPADARGSLDVMPSDRTVPALGLGEASGGRAPQSHVPSPAVCPQQRGPGFLGCNPDGGVASPTALVCLQDSDCTMGENGRCTILPVFSPLPSEAGGKLILLCGSS